MGAWRKAGVWLGLVEDDEDRDGLYDDEFDDDFSHAHASSLRDDFAVPARPRSLVRPQRSVDHDRLERDRLERSRRARERSDEYHETERAREPRGGTVADRGRGDRYVPERGRTDHEPQTVRSELRELRTERAADPDERAVWPRLTDDAPPPARPDPPVSPRPRSAPATVRPLLRPTAGSTALSLPAEEDLALAPQVQLRERAAASDDRASRRYEVTTLHPTSYSEARAIGEQFRDGHPVIMNLTEMDEPDAKRLVDFAAGLAFGLRGSMERVTNRVFLLTPPNIRVSDEEKQRIAESGRGSA
jgi:cell division inhibitor SepF